MYLWAKIFLVHNDNVISDDQELADTFNNFFEHAADNLEIQEYQSDHHISINSISDDPIHYAIAKYKNHSSIIMINENSSFESQFSFTAVNDDDIQREILNSNPKKPGTFGNILTKLLKSSSEICNVVLQNIWNSEILGKLYFPNKLKLFATLMKTFSDSQFKYCPLAWMFYSRTTNNNINKLHERALRQVYDDYAMLSYKTYGILKY